MRVLDNAREHIFDGIDIDSPQHGLRFIDAPEVGRITMARVELTIGSARGRPAAAAGPTWRVGGRRRHGAARQPSVEAALSPPNLTQGSTLSIGEDLRENRQEPA